LFNPDFIREVRSQRPRKGLRWHYFMLYLMLGSQIWLDRFERRQ
jgi:asparagine synthase (glutamine-hydrolysing)